jgi:AcrR family transcriptional regulator
VLEAVDTGGVVSQEASGASKGARTRAAILRRAADVASVEGLEGLSIGRLAGELGMSKSGLFAHFRSKGALQLATVEAAREVLVEEVLRPALAAPRGVARLWALCSCNLAYVERRVFPGGCFFVAAQAELSGRPGPLRDRVAHCQRLWLRSLEREAARAQELGELRPEVDPAQLAFELESMLFMAGAALDLEPAGGALERARVGIRARIRAGATAAAPEI